MELKAILKCVLCLSVVVSVYSAPRPAHKKQKKRHNCRCKRIFKELNEVIDSKFKLLEERLLKHIPISDSQKTSFSNIQEINSKLNTLQTEVQNTQEALVRESQAILTLNNHMVSQSRTMDTLTNSFGVLEGVVRNLTSVVERLNAGTSPRETFNAGEQSANLVMPTEMPQTPQNEQQQNSTTHSPVTTPITTTMHPVEVLPPEETTTEKTYPKRKFNTTSVIVFTSTLNL